MNSLRERINLELKEIPFIQADFSLTPLNGGTINNSYRLDSGNQSFFLKAFESDKTVALDRRRLFDIQSELFTKNLSVEPIYLSTVNHFQIDNWLECETLENLELPMDETLKTLASALASIHNLCIDAPNLNLPKQWQRYLELVGDKGTDTDLRKLDCYTQIWAQACTKKSAFCHNDLAFSHVTYQKSMKIFDWEYCAISSPYFDLASCITINRLCDVSAKRLCMVYAELTSQDKSSVIHGVQTMKPLVTFTNRLWYLATKLAV